MSLAEQAWRAALKRLQQAVESRDELAKRRARDAELTTWLAYREEMKAKAAELSKQERAEQ